MVKRTPLEVIAEETGFHYEYLKQLYIESAKHCGRGMECFVLPMVNKVVKSAVDNDITLCLAFHLKTRKMLPCDPNYQNEVLEFKKDADISNEVDVTE